MSAVKAAPRTRRPGRRDSDSTQLILPQFRPPQLASLERRVPTGDGWLFEMKLDGYRMQAAIAGAEVRLYTRNGHDWTRQFGYVAPALSRLTAGTALIDGELCAIDEDGRTNFTLLKNSLDGSKPVVFYAFDLLEQDGEDIARLPQVERKARLEALLTNLPEDSPIAYSDHIVGNGEAVFRAMCEGGFEGVIAKSPTARYYGGDRSTARVMGRSSGWSRRVGPRALSTASAALNCLANGNRIEEVCAYDPDAGIIVLSAAACKDGDVVSPCDGFVDKIAPGLPGRAKERYLHLQFPLDIAHAIEGRRTAPTRWKCASRTFTRSTT